MQQKAGESAGCDPAVRYAGQVLGNAAFSAGRLARRIFHQRNQTHLDTLITLMEDIRNSILILSFSQGPGEAPAGSPSPGPYFFAHS
jgi:hypothetical protein